MRQQSDVLDTRSLTFLTAESPLDGLEQVFAAQSFGTVTMPSGRELSYNVKPNDVTIRDNADGTRFIAGYLPRSFGGVMMKASIRVKDSDGRRNTDLHAGLLLRRALEHFDATNDRPVSEFGALWVSNQEPGWHSDNYTAYRTALGAEAKPTRQAQARAARATWTGRQMEDM